MTPASIDCPLRPEPIAPEPVTLRETLIFAEVERLEAEVESLRAEVATLRKDKAALVRAAAEDRRKGR